MKITRASRVRGSVFGAAFGDAAGRPTEFQNMARINTQINAGTLPRPALVTDDTQMMLAVGRALTPRLDELNPDALAGALCQEYVHWFYGDQAGRAPGNTCITAVSRLVGAHRPRTWQAVSVTSSKGCGANMRVQPVAYLRAPVDRRAGIAQLQAAITHGHPTALAAADLTQQAINLLVGGTPMEHLVDRLIGYALSQRTIYRETWLGNLNAYAGLALRPRRWIARGWDECLDVLASVQDAPRDLDYRDDPCRYTGDGWVAEEAFGTALYCALLYPNNPVSAISRAARTGGDSDSIACLTGSLIGAAHGDQGWPDAWYDRIEYRAELDTLAQRLA